MNELNLKKKLKNGDTTIGSWITLYSPSSAEIFSNAGFDWVLVDLEHSTISIAEAADLIRTIDLSGSTPLVRPTSINADQIKRVMDAGAHGIIVPMVNSAADAIDAVSATRYEPDGTRGVGLARAQGYGPKFSEYLEWQKKSPIVIVQIENIKAIDNLEEIFSISGVDGFIIGPYDLSCSMGIPGEFENEAFKKVLNKILETGKNMKCPAGIHIVEPNLDQLKSILDQGYTFIAYSVDIRILDDTSRKAISFFQDYNKK